MEITLRTSALSVGVLCLAAVIACGDRKGAVAAAPAGASAKALATVNGTAITEADVRQAMRRSPAGAPNHEATRNVVQTLVRDELVYQKGVELGLDKDPDYAIKMDELEAQLSAFRRQQMGALFRAYVQQHAPVTDADARAYFDRNASFIRTRFHVSEIFQKGNFAAIASDHEALKGGKSFEEVASRRISAPAGMQRPWDLGELRWNQIPAAWRGVVDRLEPGAVSDVVKGENDRFWVIKLEGKAVDPAITFETEKDRIVDILRQQKADELYASMLADMNAKARVVYTP